ncbi:hypothetical protein Ae201684P_008346 [Aphanomyces euteiches]|uniref:Cystatin domain-containing protein n=1 Tax=Aphanomyces euteiches TaxID=100861 RepID=A0A6G0XQC1_9STRA|nr:hypothetical protein Ae201684_002577 [Aphanomyces euteiches]KAH9092676.1 hypothetical protein Ae201684P_008346 [Aphanomyces euteiches]KAH9146340.1 hypothetical protein AeRB84_009818 [Aphanomyces euteiches]
MVSMIQAIAVAVVCSLPLSIVGSERVIKSITDPEVLDAAQFAVSELSQLSDTGIYTTLSLKRIKAAATQIGDFHFNTFLDLELASPHFKSGRHVESFSFVVMQSKMDGHIKSFAIDNFPVMDDDAIEIFWINMVEKDRRDRRALFAAWESETQSATSSTSLLHEKDEL